MPKTEDERMTAVINRDATILGRAVNGVIDTGRALTGRPSIWHEVRAWEVREEAAKEQAATRAMASRSAPLPKMGLPAGAVADRLAAEMAMGQTPERAAAVRTLDELAQATDLAHDLNSMALWDDLYAQTAELATNRAAMELLAERGISMSSGGLLVKAGPAWGKLEVAATDLRAVVAAERGRDDANLTMPTERDPGRVVGGR